VLEYLQRMARYNQWMNQKLHAKVQLLFVDDIAKDHGALLHMCLTIKPTIVHKSARCSFKRA